MENEEIKYWLEDHNNSLVFVALIIGIIISSAALVISIAWIMSGSIGHF